LAGCSRCFAGLSVARRRREIPYRSPRRRRRPGVGFSQGPATIITRLEGGSHIVYLDVEVEDAESALAKAWAAYKAPRWPLKLVDEQADDNGWSRRKRFEYQASPNERRSVVAGAMFADDRWTVWIYDVADEVGGKRSGAVGLLF
jgi:hypothetical protein